MVINIEFDTVYGEFEKHSPIKGDFEGILNLLKRTVLIDSKSGSAADNVFSDIKIEEEKGTQYHTAFRKQENKRLSLSIKNKITTI